MMPEFFPHLSRIWLSVAFAVYGLVMLTTLHWTDRKLQNHILMLVCFVASGVTLFHSTVLRLPGWPPFLTALFLTVLTVGTFRFAKSQYWSGESDE